MVYQHFMMHELYGLSEEKIGIVERFKNFIK